MEWLFWGWLKSLIQYAFYPVVANAYLFVFGNLLIHFMDSHPPPYDGATIAVFFFPLVLLLIAFTYGILKIPSLVNSLFTGPLRRIGYAATSRGDSMPDMNWMPPAQRRTFNAAKRQYVELYGSTAVMNTYLKIALLCLCVVCVALIVLNIKTYQRVSQSEAAGHPHQ